MKVVWQKDVPAEIYCIPVPNKNLVVPNITGDIHVKDQLYHYKETFALI